MNKRLVWIFFVILEILSITTCGFLMMALIKPLLFIECNGNYPGCAYYGAFKYITKFNNEATYENTTNKEVFIFEPDIFTPASGEVGTIHMSFFLIYSWPMFLFYLFLGIILVRRNQQMVQINVNEEILQ
ncbi:hypothetical protein RF11_04236 [Thelohanellus kitauei]|uniref:Uncharacterized protein n=1 Tax=Thelohanellus kitauei TaxID=669202 RepID=A0A0C2JFL6_THEKT|nr:hypothetical protein RF11_04236 [Thelohanellus kitauei]